MRADFQFRQLLRQRLDAHDVQRVNERVDGGVRVGRLLPVEQHAVHPLRQHALAVVRRLQLLDLLVGEPELAHQRAQFVLVQRRLDDVERFQQQHICDTHRRVVQHVYTAGRSAV